MLVTDCSQYGNCVFARFKQGVCTLQTMGLEASNLVEAAVIVYDGLVMV